jgi:hypothetical protein
MSLEPFFVFYHFIRRRWLNLGLLRAGSLVQTRALIFARLFELGSVFQMDKNEMISIIALGHA